MHLATGRAADVWDRAPRRKDLRARIHRALSPRPCHPRFPKPEVRAHGAGPGRRGPARAVAAPEAAPSGRRAGRGRAVGRDRGPPRAGEPVAQPRCSGGRSKAAPCPRGARTIPRLCALLLGARETKRKCQEHVNQTRYSATITSLSGLPGPRAPPPHPAHRPDTCAGPSRPPRGPAGPCALLRGRRRGRAPGRGPWGPCLAPGTSLGPGVPD